MPLITFSEFLGAIARFIIAVAIMLSPYFIDAAFDRMTGDWFNNSLPPVEEKAPSLYSDEELTTFHSWKP